MREEFSQKFFEALKHRYKDDPGHWTSQKSDHYIYSIIARFITDICRPGSRADWYSDNPTIKEVGRSMGYKTSKLFREAMQAAEDKHT